MTSLVGLKDGDPVVLRDGDGNPVVVMYAYIIGKGNQYALSSYPNGRRERSRRAYASTGRVIGGGNLVAVPCTPEVATQVEERINAQLHADLAREEKEIRARNKATFDALPEPMRYARIIATWLNEEGTAKKLANCPVEILRPLSAWIAAREDAPECP